MMDKDVNLNAERRAMGGRGIGRLEVKGRRECEGNDVVVGSRIVIHQFTLDFSEFWVDVLFVLVLSGRYSQIFWK